MFIMMLWLWHQAQPLRELAQIVVVSKHRGCNLQLPLLPLILGIPDI